MRVLTDIVSPHRSGGLVERNNCYDFYTCKSCGRWLTHRDVLLAMTPRRHLRVCTGCGGATYSPGEYHWTYRLSLRFWLYWLLRRKYHHPADIPRSAVA